MPLVIIGAGAIGGSVGAHLARDGHDILLVDTVAEHVAAIAGPGLRVEGRERFTQRIPAVTPDALAARLGGRPPETLILAVKAQHTAAALAPVLPLLGEATTVFSMQNGLNPREIAALVGAERTVASLLNSMATDYQEPGRILFGGPGTIRIGELDGRVTPRVERLVAMLRASFVANTEATANIWGHLWGKEAYATWLFAQAVSGETIADVLDAPENRAMLANLAAEVIRVAEAEGIRVEAVDAFAPDALRFGVPRDSDAVRTSLATMAAISRPSLKPRSGIWRDLAVRDRPTEVDAQLAPVVAMGRRHGIPTPLVERLVAMIHALERKAIAMGPQNLAILRTLDAAAYS